MALVNYDSSEDEASDVEEKVIASQPKAVPLRPLTGSDRVEMEYLMRVPKSAKLSTLVPDLTASKTKTGKILLSVPSLETLDSSSSGSDEEDSTDTNSTTKQRSKKSFGRSSSDGSRAVGGLLSLLPPTGSGIVRNGPKPAVMIPPQLLVRRTTQINQGNIPQSSSATTSTVLDSSEDAIGGPANVPTTICEEDEQDVKIEPSSFFSFYKPAQEDAQAVATVRANAANKVVQSMTYVSSSTSVTEPIPVEASEPSVNGISSSSTEAGRSQTGAPQMPSLCSINPAVLSEFSALKRNDSKTEDDDGSDEPQFWTDQTLVPAPERKRARLTHPGARTLPVHDLLSSSNQVIREVNQADLTAGADVELMKSVTADESQYVSQRAKADDDPGKLAHRKHQITWLAFQAQENQIELEKRWAEARRNKATNRAKYGF
ncbi:Proline-rich protein PRCC [Paragonimus heterotremus]|uniref:Proline-rich protein PRCC n=1 Tax=Paragonimus heterotremus TaxID=100268 RepID=A0A8J4T3K3_9TREM|nr:Proline-rich protein PRCC [Paragonimus heterotremus]